MKDAWYTHHRREVLDKRDDPSYRMTAIEFRISHQGTRTYFERNTGRDRINVYKMWWLYIFVDTGNPVYNKITIENLFAFDTTHDPELVKLYTLELLVALHEVLLEEDPPPTERLKDLFIIVMYSVWAHKPLARDITRRFSDYFSSGELTVAEALLASYVTDQDRDERHERSASLLPAMICALVNTEFWDEGYFVWSIVGHPETLSAAIERLRSKGMYTELAESRLSKLAQEGERCQTT